MRRTLAAAVAATVLITMSACGGGGVPWEDYAPGLQARIDAAAAAGDCAALQTEFNNADANNAATRARTGHGNVELMGYIDDALRSAGCYK